MLSLIPYWLSEIPHLPLLCLGEEACFNALSIKVCTHFKTQNIDQNTYIKGMNKHPTAISNKLISSHQKISEYQNHHFVAVFVLLFASFEYFCE